MKGRTNGAVVFLSLAAALSSISCVSRELDEKDKAMLQGSWKIVTIESNGLSGNGGEAIEGSIVFEGDKLILRSVFLPKKRLHNIRGTYKLNANWKPMQFDLSDVIVESGESGEKKWAEKLLGIFELEDGNLKISWSPIRPTRFTSEKGETHIVYILKRQ